MRIGDVDIHPISDGTFVARPSYFGPHVAPGSRPDLFDRDGAAWLPIGCFLVRTGSRIVLVDAGLGPELQELPDGMHLVGGQLPTGLRAAGVSNADVTDIVCSHLHSDHVGWLFDGQGEPSFANATIWFGAADWDHFVTGPGHLDDHIRAGFRGAAADIASRLRPLEHDTAIAPGLTALLTPGHTPGHLCVAIASGAERALLLGDAITAPVQLDEPGWHSFGDVDPGQADRTRERLWRELEDGRTVGVGAHFPELRFGRVASATSRRWVT